MRWLWWRRPEDEPPALSPAVILEERPQSDGWFRVWAADECGVYVWSQLGSWSDGG